MSIQELPLNTVRSIGSSLAITDPVSAVKELIDNALDAQARAVFVEISSDTLETIQVQDNGHGISPENRSMICKHHCTSKIRQFSDIKDIGGRSLGFRGEALASAAEINRSINVTTRVEGEELAVSMSFAKDGTMEKSQVSTHAVGTTIRLMDLFDQLPVRKQAALKRESKTHDDLKSLMESYAFARPRTKFSLKFLKFKGPKASWSYVPSPDGDIHDTACKVVGTECARNCAFVEFESSGYRVQAFLPKNVATTTNIGNKKHFLSVDSRPVSTSRGVFKQIATMCRERIKKTLASELKSPFFQMNLICPPESYDANVEPSKNDLIFEDEHKIIAAVSALLDSYYPLVASDDGRDNEFGCSVDSSARQTPQPFVEPQRSPETLSIEDNAIRRDSMAEQIFIESEDTEEIPEQGHCNDVEDDETCSGLLEPDISNPWVFAKLHASTRKRQNALPLDLPTSSERIMPAQSRMSPWLPRTVDMSRHTSPSEPDLGQLHGTEPPSSQYEMLSSPTRPTDFSLGPNIRLGAMIPGIQPLHRRHPLQRQPVQSLQSSEDGSIESESRQKTRRPQRATKQRPFKSPVTEETRNWFSNLPKQPSPTKSGASELTHRREGIDIRKAFEKRQKLNPRPQRGDSSIVQAELVRDHGSQGRCLGDPRRSESSEEMHSSLDEALGETPEDSRMQHVVVTLQVSLQLLAELCLGNQRTNTELFGAVGKDAYDPPWSTAMDDQPTSLFIYSRVRHWEFDQWSARIAGSLNRRYGASLPRDKSDLREELSNFIQRAASLTSSSPSCSSFLA